MTSRGVPLLPKHPTFYVKLRIILKIESVDDNQYIAVVFYLLCLLLLCSSPFSSSPVEAE